MLLPNRFKLQSWQHYCLSLWVCQIKPNSLLCFHDLWGLSIDIMIVILYKLYILSPYTNSSHHTKLFAFLHFQNSSLCTIYKLFSSWGPTYVPTRITISDIDTFVGNFCPHIRVTHTQLEFAPQARTLDINCNNQSK